MAARGTVTSSRAGSAGTASVVTGTFPVGTVVGDRIAVATNINNGTATVVATCGANTWTATHGPDDPVAATERVYLFERVLDATDVATGVVTFTWSGTGTPGRIQCGGLVWPAGDTATPFGTVTVSTSAVNTATAPAFTTASASSDVYLIAGCRIAAGNFSGVVVPPAAYTEDYDVITTVATNANTEVSASHLTTPVASGSSVGGGSLTSGAAATHWVIYVNELRSAVAASVTAVLATGSAQAFAPTVTGAAAVSAVVATATAQAFAPTVTGVRVAAVSAPVATATGQAFAPTVAAVASATVSAPVATGTSQAFTPAVSGSAGVTAVVAAASALAYAPTVVGVSSVTVAAATAYATALAYAPVVTGGALILAARALGQASAFAPSVVVTVAPRPTPPERVTSFTFPDRSSSLTLPERTSSLILPSRTTSTTLGA